MFYTVSGCLSLQKQNAFHSIRCILTKFVEKKQTFVIIIKLIINTQHNCRKSKRNFEKAKFRMNDTTNNVGRNTAFYQIKSNVDLSKYIESMICIRDRFNSQRNLTIYIDNLLECDILPRDRSQLLFSELAGIFPDTCT